MKVGNRRLFQATRSPLIQGISRRRRPAWPLIAAVLVAVAAAGVWAYLAYVR